MNINKMQQFVYDVIQAHPGVQNNDSELVAACWREQGWSDSRSLEENIKRVSRGESLCRRRRELHQMGLITYSKEAQESRQEAFENEQNIHSTHEAISWLND